MTLRRAEDNKYVLTTHSKSLFNVSQSPGWTEEENQVLKLAIMFYGVGNWAKFTHLGLLPGGKVSTQISLQAQRMLGQQSLGGFMHLKVDPDEVRRDNERRAQEHQDQMERLRHGEALREGEELFPVRVKSGLVINTGQNPTKESRLKQLEQNKKRYALREMQIKERVCEFDLFRVKRKRRLEFTAFLQEYLNLCREQSKQVLEEEHEKLSKEEGDEEVIVGKNGDEATLEALDEQMEQIQSELSSCHDKLSKLWAQLPAGGATESESASTSTSSQPPSKKRRVSSSRR